MKKLPIGIQTFENLIDEGYYYVDKTHFVHQLSSEGKYYFLSRPRRFGKSLFLSTIKAAFQGKKDLFQGLFLENNWDWDRVNPVVHVSFGSGVVRNVSELEVSFDEILYDHGLKYNIEYVKKSLKGKFAELIFTLHEKTGQKVVILIDEYDKPVLDNIEKKDMAVAIREELKNYYSVIKDADPYIKFVFITGVSKFSKVSLFSGLNNLEDITLNQKYSDICGYTQDELETVFADFLEGVDLNQVRLWYNGYNWLGKEVYNPFDILLYLKSKVFSNYWFETGTPSFLIKMLYNGQYNIPGIENLKAGEEIVGSFDVENITAETLLFQAGYLTITGFEQVGSFRRYTLTYPNMEVKSSLNNSILSTLAKDSLAKTRNQSDLIDALLGNDLDSLKDIFHAFFASIPHDWYRKNQLSRYEGYYASVVYCYFAALGLDVRAEESTSKGRLDLVIRFQGRVYILEFKVVELAGEGRPIEQIKDRGYADKYVGQEVYLIGVEFSSKERNVVGFEWE
ncbi:ATP-binding protein [Desulfonatronovibrio magnus]|uniref:ATP-binding protein n=1 Tax=Desulfonatronovibrio magnus TaxID=698827 RepID=UPI0005EAE1BD|nr:ATP-binding protein [Desulfonatronovibrio magnus]